MFTAKGDYLCVVDCRDLRMISMKEDNFDTIADEKEEEELLEELGISCWDSYDNMSEFQNK